MKVCPQCGLKHEKTVMTCDCGYDLSKVQSDEEKQNESDLKILEYKKSSQMGEGAWLFNQLISPVLIQFVYVIGAIGITVWGGRMIISALNMSSRYTDYAGRIFLTGFALLIIGNLLWRMVCEGWIIYFNIHDKLGSILSYTKFLSNDYQQHEFILSNIRENLRNQVKLTTLHSNRQDIELLTDIKNLLESLSNMEEKEWNVSTHTIPFSDTSSLPPQTKLCNETHELPQTELPNQISHKDGDVYKIIFYGKIQSGFDTSEVKEKFLELYKNIYNRAQIEQLFFSGKPAVVKNDIKYEKAIKLKEAFMARTGGIFEVKLI